MLNMRYRAVAKFDDETRVIEGQPVGGQAACGMWTLEHMHQRVTIFKRSITCAKCRKMLGLKPKRKLAR